LHSCAASGTTVRIFTQRCQALSTEGWSWFPDGSCEPSFVIVSSWYSRNSCKAFKSECIDVVPTVHSP
jgi:hypothetical protein